MGLNNKIKRYGSRIKEQRTNFLFLNDGSLVYDYDKFDSMENAIIDAVVNFGEDLDDMIAHCYSQTNSHLKEFFEKEIPGRPRKKFPKLERFIEESYRYFPSQVVYDAAEKLLDVIRNHNEFQSGNNEMNSDADVRRMFDEIVDRHIEDEYIDLNDTESDAFMENYNILTDSDLNKVLKDELFSIVRKSK